MFAEAVQPGLRRRPGRVRDIIYILRRLHGIFIARLTAEPVYELRRWLSLHAHLLRGNHVAVPAPGRGNAGAASRSGTRFRIRDRSRWMKCGPHPAPRNCCWDFAEVVVPALRDAMERHSADTHVLADQPTRVGAAVRSSGTGRLDRIRPPGGVGPGFVSDREAALPAPRMHSRSPSGGRLRNAPEGNSRCVCARQCRGRLTDGPADARFPDPYNMGVNAEVFLYDERQPADQKVLMMFYKRLREIDDAGDDGGDPCGNPGKALGYYRDMTRQLWDEARHAMMGKWDLPASAWTGPLECG